MDLNKMLKDGGYSRFCDHDITDQMLENWLSITEKKKRNSSKSVAKLAAIKLTDADEKKFEKDLNIILEHVDALSKMNIEDEEINIHPLGEKLNLREDVSSEFLTHDEAMSNSPETEDGHFVVPPSLD